ncbi:hypothetical protein BU24DRAFT_424311 [Aaosphaeria arxii CBS 175.79]|uniref:Uncharacterized protein n=1 Tax=Aaosphaeria arxii CBS 175.79 TaxID=1450172 RepID=A0A6A5XLW1_9PLEO|nr:uncharacterized protein BU24DRAFT_424311 [Aaosphaeria arxii CBS 175.79]KAF2013304.1 hypothetical protein BU24DRAFT_424311 [Aaosphaeria arxii CBS 175.79]
MGRRPRVVPALPCHLPATTQYQPVALVVTLPASGGWVVSQHPVPASSAHMATFSLSLVGLRDFPTKLSLHVGMW